MDIIEEAENLIGDYAERQLNESLYTQKVCGCRACVARANSWLEWTTGDEDGLYEQLQVPPNHETLA